MFLFYTAQTIFKQLWVSHVKRHGLPLLGFMFTRARELYLKDCEMVAPILKQLPGECQLEELSFVRSNIDLPLADSAPDYVTSMGRLELNDSHLRLGDPDLLRNLQCLVLNGKSTWENLSTFGRGLSGLKTLKLIFDSDIQKNFESTASLAKFLPKRHKLQQLSIVYREQEFMSVLSKVMEHQLNKISKQTTIELESIKFDSSLEGLERFPGEFFASAKAKSPIWPDIKGGFKCIDYKIPALKSLEVYQEKEGVHIELHNPNEKFEFLILEK